MPQSGWLAGWPRKIRRRYAAGMSAVLSSVLLLQGAVYSVRRDFQRFIQGTTVR